MTQDAKEMSEKSMIERKKKFQDRCQSCMFYNGQEDVSGEIVISYCTHDRNKNDLEGNTNEADCPIENNQD